MKKVLLIIIICIAFFLRFYQLGINPPSLTWDEAAWGYNAYSMGIDGRDEFGRFLPHDYLESFGDFKPPMYAYLDVIPVKVFGLTPFATRFPSAFLGTLTVLVTYFLVKRLFIKRGNTRNSTQNYAEYIALASSLMLAISPWHIMLSRAAFEANVATFFLAGGVWLFLAGVQDRQWFLTLSIASFVASIYTFNSARIVAPILVIVLSVGFWKILRHRKKIVLVSIIIGVLLVLPALKFLLSPQARLRFQEVNIFSDISVIKMSNQEILNDHNAWWSKILHNRRLLFAGDFLQHYIDNLTPDFLFIHGDGNPKFSTQDVGEMYLWDIPFFVAGSLFLFRRREGSWWIIPLWLLLGIIPAATARETPHALRIEATLPTFQIIAAYGFVSILFMIKRYRFLILNFLFLILALNVLYFQHGYYAHYPAEYSDQWQYGYEESIAYAASQYNNFDKIQVTQSLGRPYIYYLFFLKIDPNFYRQTAVIQRDSFGFVTVKSFGKFSFIRTASEKFTGNVLFIDSPVDVPKYANVLKKFNLLNGQTVLEAYTL